MDDEDQEWVLCDSCGWHGLWSEVVDGIDDGATQMWICPECGHVDDGYAS